MYVQSLQKSIKVNSSNYKSVDYGDAIKSKEKDRDDLVNMMQ